MDQALTPEVHHSQHLSIQILTLGHFVIDRRKQVVTCLSRCPGVLTVPILVQTTETGLEVEGIQCQLVVSGTLKRGVG